MKTQKSGLSSASSISNSRMVRLFERELHPPLRRAGSDGQVKITLCDGELAVGGAGLTGLVTLDDLVNVDVAPAAGAPIDDLENRLLAKKLADVPGVPAEPLRASWFAVRTGCRANGLAVDHQVDARLAGIASAPDQEIQIRPFDAKRRAGQGPGGVVSAVERIDQTPAKITGNGHLSGKRPLRRAWAECVAGGRPAPVARPLEIGDQMSDRVVFVSALEHGIFQSVMARIHPNEYRIGGSLKLSFKREYRGGRQPSASVIVVLDPRPR